MIKGTGPRYYCRKCGRSVRGGEALFIGCNEPNCPIKKAYGEDFGWRFNWFLWIGGFIGLIIVYNVYINTTITWRETNGVVWCDPNPSNDKAVKYCREFNFLSPEERNKNWDKIGKSESI